MDNYRKFASRYAGEKPSRDRSPGRNFLLSVVQSSGSVEKLKTQNRLRNGEIYEDKNIFMRKS